MTEARQIGEDLRFVRDAVRRREQGTRGPASIYWVWAAYVLIGYTMIDLLPQVAGWFFLVGGIAGGVLSGVIGRRASLRLGELDRAEARRAGLHWTGGILLAMLATVALASIIPSLRGAAGSQVLVVMIGLVYFLAGVHFERHFLWLGPVLITGGVVVGFVPRYGWTALGIVIAFGLVIPTLLPPRTREPAAPGASDAAPA